MMNAERLAPPSNDPTPSVPCGTAVVCEMIPQPLLPIPTDRASRVGGDAPPTAGIDPRGLNPFRHGLTAMRRLPEVLGQDLLDGLIAAFEREWQPASPLEAVLVRELARHAAALQRAEEAELALLRQGAAAIGPLLVLESNDPPPGDAEERALAAAFPTEAVDRLTRYRRAHERGFYAAYARLAELERSRHAGIVQRRAEAAADMFPNEDACENYLRKRLDSGDYPCLACGARRGYWLAARRRWECARCGRQWSVRSGTVMAGSRLPLKTWFEAIRQVLFNPDIDAEELAAALRIRRLATVRSVSQRIRQALASLGASQLLAGLDQFFHPIPLGGLREASAVRRFFQNKQLGQPSSDVGVLR